MRGVVVIGQKHVNVHFFHLFYRRSLLFLLLLLLLFLLLLAQLCMNLRFLIGFKLLLVKACSLFYEKIRFEYFIAHLYVIKPDVLFKQSFMFTFVMLPS